METDAIKRQLDAVGKNIDRILSHLESDEKTKREGLVEQVMRLQKELYKHNSDLKIQIHENKEKLTKLQDKVILISSAGTVLIQVFWFLLTKIFKVI